MIERTMRAAGLGLVLALAGAALACGNDDDRAGRDTARDGSTISDETTLTPPAGLDGPASTEMFEVDPGERAYPGSTGPGASPPAAMPGATTPPATAPGTTTSPGTQPSPDATALSASTDAILRATARRYEQVRSIQAEFVQQLRNPLLGQTTRSRGMLYQRQPDRFLMRFTDPGGDMIVGDGEFFWVYYPSVDARQVMRITGGGPGGLDLHSQFIGDPTTRFQATPHGQESVGGRTAHVLTLVPRQPMGYRSLKVWIDTDDHLVRRFELTEDTGNVRHFELSNVVINPSLPDHLFQFTPPAGAQVIQR
jgi:outer membrane lipoprotein carrier protein